MKKFLLIGLVAAFLAAGCAHLQLESGTYPNQGMNDALIGGAIGAVPGIITGNNALAWGGALLGAGIGGAVGSQADTKNMIEARAYREQIRQEWMQTYQTLAKSTTGEAGVVRPPRVIVVDAERHSSRNWEYGVILDAEQGLRQRGFEVVVPSDDFYRSYYRRVARDYSSYDADFLAEVLIQDLDSAVKVILTLRSLTGKSALDRQGVGRVSYSREYYRYGPSRDERRSRAAQIAAKRAVENLFIYKYESTLEAGT